MYFQVEYECDGFLHKNRDTVMEEQIAILKVVFTKIRESIQFLFSQVATSQMCNFPGGYFPNVQFPMRKPKSVLAAAFGPYSVLATALCPLAHPSHSARPPTAACGASKGFLRPGRGQTRRGEWGGVRRDGEV